MEMVPQNSRRVGRPDPVRPTGSYASFIAENPGTGYLKIQASRGQGAIPVGNLRATVFQVFENLRVQFFEGRTDADGLIEDIPLPAPPVAESLNASSAKGGALYQVYTELQSFEPQMYTIEIFDGITAILPVLPILSREGN